MTLSTHKKAAVPTSSATVTITVADGDDNTNGQFDEGDYVIITSTDGTKRVYVQCDGSESGASATGTVLTTGDDTGASTLAAGTAALGTCVAFQNNLNTHTQALILNELKAAIVHANGHNGKITAGADVSGDGEKSIIFTQAATGHGADSTITSTLNIVTFSKKRVATTTDGFSGGHLGAEAVDKHTVAAGGTAGGFNSTANIKSNLDLAKGIESYGSKVIAKTGTATKTGVALAKSGGTMAYNPQGRSVTLSSNDVDGYSSTANTGWLIRGGSSTLISGIASTDNFLAIAGSDVVAEARRGRPVIRYRRKGAWSDTILDLFNGKVYAADGAAKTDITGRGTKVSLAVDGAVTSKETTGEFVILSNFADYTTDATSGGTAAGTNLKNYSDITG